MKTFALSLFHWKGNCIFYTCIYGDTKLAAPLRMTISCMTALLVLERPKMHFYFKIAWKNIFFFNCIETDESNHGLADTSGGENCVVLSSVSSDHDYGATAQQPADQLAAAQAEIARLNAEVASMREERCFLTRLSKDDELVIFYTGFPSYVTLMAFFQCIEPSASRMTTYSQHRRRMTQQTACTHVVSSDQCTLSVVTQFRLVLRKLRVGNIDKELADIHGISTSTISRIIISWINYLNVVLGSMPLWPSRQTVDVHMPAVFKERYASHCRGPNSNTADFMRVKHRRKTCQVQQHWHGYVLLCDWPHTQLFGKKQACSKSPETTSCTVRRMRRWFRWVNEMSSFVECLWFPKMQSNTVPYACQA